jgi:hypothetical protein
MLICLTFSKSCFAQTPQFDLTEYQKFIEQHRNMTVSELLEMHPTGAFKGDVNVPWESVQCSDLVEAACNLTQYEKSLLYDNGFVVTERFRTESLIDQMMFVWNNDLPLFISTDAILHALGIAYDKILIDVEVGVLYDRLGTLLSRMHASLPALAERYSADSGMDRMLRDVDVYLTVPRMLLKQWTLPITQTTRQTSARLWP